MASGSSGVLHKDDFDVIIAVINADTLQNDKNEIRNKFMY